MRTPNYFRDFHLKTARKRQSSKKIAKISTFQTKEIAKNKKNYNKRASMHQSNPFNIAKYFYIYLLPSITSLKVSFFVKISYFRSFKLGTKVCV